MKTIAWHQSAETQTALVYLLRTAGVGIGTSNDDLIVYDDRRIKVRWRDGWTVIVNYPVDIGSLVLETTPVEVQTYRPGLWEQYVVELHREIAHDEALLENERFDELAKLRLEAFQPIDDAEIFPELVKGA